MSTQLHPAHRLTSRGHRRDSGADRLDRAESGVDDFTSADNRSRGRAGKGSDGGGGQCLKIAGLILLVVPVVLLLLLARQPDSSQAPAEFVRTFSKGGQQLTNSADPQQKQQQQQATRPAAAAAAATRPNKAASESAGDAAAQTITLKTEMHSVFSDRYAQHATENAKERALLIEFAEATNWKGWGNSNGWMTDQHICSWYGITCNSQKTNVQSM